MQISIHIEEKEHIINYPKFIWLINKLVNLRQKNLLNSWEILPMRINSVCSNGVLHQRVYLT